MKNPIRRMADNFGSFMNNDQMAPFTKYGIAPTNYLATDPRYTRRPHSQTVPSSDQSSRLQKNLQAGEILSGRVPKQTLEQNYAREVEEFTDSPNTGFYRHDPRIPDVDAESGRSDFQDRPGGYPIVPQTGLEGAIDPRTIGAYDRNSGELNNPSVFGNQLSYQGSADQFSTSPMWLLGGSNYGPRASQFFIPDEMEDYSAHPDQVWIQTHRNAVQHTIGHDHPYTHRDHQIQQVRFSVTRIVPGAPQ